MPSPRRRQASGRSSNPSARIRSPCDCTRVATRTRKPASRAARAIGRRWVQKYQSSVTRKIKVGPGERAYSRVSGLKVMGRDSYQNDPPAALAADADTAIATEHWCFGESAVSPFHGEDL